MSTTSSRVRLTPRLKLIIAFVYVFLLGVSAGVLHLFPSSFFELGLKGWHEANPLFGMPWYYREVDRQARLSTSESAHVSPGLNLVSRIAADHKLVVEVVDMLGESVHTWDVDWFRVWPDAEHFNSSLAPKARPGTHIHGAVLLDNGNLVYNYEHLGLVCLDFESNVVWRLPYQTHHTVHRHDDGNLWVCGHRRQTEAESVFPNREAPYDEYTLLEVSPNGDIVNEWSVAGLLRQNGYAGLLGLAAHDAYAHYTIEKDIIHLNDVEPFPEGMTEGFFKKGDVLVSLRNINTVFVFNKLDSKIKYISTGRFIAQHDPDFIDGNRISLFDNRARASDHGLMSSRIVIVSALDGTVEEVYRGSEASKFYTRIMGKHQWLPGGHVLITESLRGRAFEVNRAGDVVWEYFNYVDDNTVGVVEEVTRLNAHQERLFTTTTDSSVAQTSLSESGG